MGAVCGRGVVCMCSFQKCWCVQMCVQVCVCVSGSDVDLGVH